MSFTGKLFIALFFVIVATGRGRAQSYDFRGFQVEHGLSSNSVTSSIQDKQGFVWFGTKDGLNRFDGYLFKVFRNEAHDSLSISNNYIYCLHADTDDVLWVGTDRGLCRYDPVLEQFHVIKETSATSVTEIQTDKQGDLWYIADYTLYRRDSKTGRISKYNESGYAVTSVCLAPDNTIWISTIGGLLKRYSRSTNSFAGFDVFKNSKASLSKWIQKIEYDGNGHLLVGTMNYGLKLFDTGSGSYKDVVTKNAKNRPFVTDFVRHTKDDYWISTESGLFIYTPKNGDYLLPVKDNDGPFSIATNTTNALYKDREGGIWICTNYRGVHYFPRQYSAFKNYTPRYAGNSTSGNILTNIAQDKNGDLWIGTTESGLNKMTPATGVFTNYQPSNASGIALNNIAAVLVAGDQIWTGASYGVDLWDSKSAKVVRHYDTGTDYLGKGNIFSKNVSCLYRTRAGVIYAGTLSGLFYFNPKLNRFDRVTQVANCFYTTLREDSRGVLWAGTFKEGVYFFDPRTGRSGNYRYTANNSRSLNSNWINSVFESADKTIWVATTKGLCKLDSDRKRFTAYTTENGFPSNVVLSILEDARNNLWISTSRGLVCFKPSTAKLKIFTTANGLYSDQFNSHSAYKDADGRMYFGTAKGLISFHPAEFTDSRAALPVYITGFQVNNEEVAVNTKSPLKRSVIYTREITLPYKSSFSIDFAALSYTTPELTQYAYHMAGLSNDWTYLKTNRKVYFTGLSAGTYTFSVKASNTGDWHSKPAVLIIKVLPPFWASIWAYLFYITIAGTAIYFIVRHYHQRAVAKKEKELYQAKLEFFTNIAHEIRTPLTLIKGPLDQVIEASHAPAIQENLEIMEKNTDLLLELTNQLLDFRKIENKGFSMNITKCNITDLLKDHYLRFKPAIEQKRLLFTINAPQTYFAYADKEALNKIISNLFDNAIKYAKSRVYVTLVDTGEKFTISVKNDGHIIAYDLKDKVFETFFRLKETERQTGTGIGLALARSLAELNRGTLVLQEPEDDMNVFELSLPALPHNLAQQQQAPPPEQSYYFNEATKDEAADRPVILVVDDNADILHFVSSVLNPAYEVLTAPNGQEALDLLAQQPVALVISDVMMPVMDGLELCLRIKSKLECSHVPVILLTAKNTMQAKIDGLEQGADAYIEKPFMPKHLLVQIKNLLTNRDKVKEHFANTPLAPIKAIAHSRADEQFLEALNKFIRDNLVNTNLDVELLAGQMNMSRSTLYRKISAITNMSPHELINVTRLKRAAELLAETDYKLYRISSMVGYSSLDHFRRNFTRQFGMSPSEYLNTMTVKS
ncbi:hybrid sensor histidine kinase/response regulator [Mucilaginibacter hurinus]|uniref:histidine kinase n=1 Tax=Mucilaginibacter hurinus TaxID=2201324 RepID=A0A367GKL4_9SPHI|nr:hybrid sensor histidine kinase/response regulator transcription factor [Mucilaginibacter hurinus]RCH53860.1 hybrid sensor histidine kinase/response regulator [Mucilaginibacter hurinus]